MSKFGSDDGSNSNGPKNDQVSVDGFRLDSSQSSWLMDRLGALDEEDKLSLSGSAAQAQTPDVQMPGVQMSDNSDDHTPGQRPSHQQDYEASRDTSRDTVRDNVSPLHPQHSTGGQQRQNQMNVNKVPVHPSYQAEQPIGGAPQENSEQAGEIDSESALLLRQKIENLEQQLAEISDLTGEQRAHYVEELTEPQGRGPVGPPHIEDDHGFIEDGSEYDEGRDAYGAHSSAGAHRDIQAGEPQGYAPHSPEHTYHVSGDANQVASDSNQLSNDAGHYPSSHEPHVSHSHAEAYGSNSGGEVHHDPEALTGLPDYSDHSPHQQPSHGHERRAVYQQDEQAGYEQQPHAENFVGRQDVHPHMQQTGHVQHTSHQQDYAELPQFLAPVQHKKKGRPVTVTVLGSLVVLLLAGGGAYTYYNGGVSDIIKGDLSSAGFKEASKLSDAKQDRVDQSVLREAGVVTSLSKTDLKQKFSVTPLAGIAGQNVPLGIQLPNDQRLSSAFLVVRNLPEWAKLNYGRQMNGLWMVSVSQVDALHVIVPEDQPGKFSFEIDLVVNAGDAPVTKKVLADIAPYKAPEPVKTKQPVITPPSQQKQEVATVTSETDNPELIKQPSVGVNKGPLIIDQALEEKWLERGTRLLRAGDVSAARLAFSHLAEQGSGRAALAMGMTYDPNQPSARVVSGIKLDKKQARFWYQRALSLGHEGARDPLRHLDR